MSSSNEHFQNRRSTDGTANRPRILIVEDDKDTRFMMAQVAEKNAWEYAMAEDGQQAVEMYCDGLKSYHPFNLILLDCALPYLSGFEVVARVKEYQPDVPILMVTAYHDDFMHAHAGKVKADALMYKPVDISALEAKVGELLAAS